MSICPGNSPKVRDDWFLDTGATNHVSFTEGCTAPMSLEQESRERKVREGEREGEMRKGCASLILEEQQQEQEEVAIVAVVLRSSDIAQ
jgi:hypothetical protein